MNARLASALLLVLSSLAAAQVPLLFDFQGKLAYANGTLYHGSTSITFRFFTAHTGGSFLWSETQTVSVQNGAFDAVLGGVNPINFSTAVQRFLELVVGGETLSPRLNTTSAPHALRAENATNATFATTANNSDFVDGFHAFASGSATAGQLVALDGSAKFPNARLYTGSGLGLDADTVDALHASDILASASGRASIALSCGAALSGWTCNAIPTSDASTAGIPDQAGMFRAATSTGAVDWCSSGIASGVIINSCVSISTSCAGGWQTCTRSSITYVAVSCGALSGWTCAAAPAAAFAFSVPGGSGIYHILASTSTYRFYVPGSTTAASTGVTCASGWQVCVK